MLKLFRFFLYCINLVRLYLDALASKCFRKSFIYNISFPLLAGWPSFYVSGNLATVNLGSFRSRRGLRVIVEGGRLNIGDGVFFNRDCSVNCLSDIFIGKNTIIGEGVRFYDHNHRFRDPEKLIKNQGFSLGKIYVGENCWIGSGVVVLKGACIGDGSVIGANVVVSSDVPRNTILINTGGVEFSKRG